MGPNPAVAEVRRAVRSALTGQAVLVACSGGADSLALAAATAFEASRAGIAAALITVDHGLQPGSDAQARTVAAIGYELGFDPVEVVTVDVGSDGGPEAAARTARYAALDGVANALGADVLLGHTLDDQAETVLLGLGRGSGPRSIAGMRPVDGRYRRPLLGVRRATTEAACAALGLTPWDDPHNADPAYQRVRLRREVLPLLDDVLQGGVAEALARTAALVRADADALDQLAELHHEDVLDAEELEALPAAIRTRVLRSWAHAAGTAPLTSEHTRALDGLITDWHGQGPIDLPGGFAAVRASGRLTMRPHPKE
ncbi:MAG TPA: tRNA lysidine(34) synthetase TilS [Jatrophihabitantaceae bacterium]|jgi:tRNA(Ile)-lysidine synthase